MEYVYVARVMTSGMVKTLKMIDLSVREVHEMGNPQPSP